MITLPSLEAPDRLAHGFFTREGGVSGGLYASLNCGFGSSDNADHVAENRERAMGRLSLRVDALVTAYQVHGVNVRVVARDDDRRDPTPADAMVTRASGIALGILTADCAPVLFADAEAGVIGAAHAGWRGALAGVLATTLEAMEKLGARRDRINAAIGPCIAQASYEVGPEFPAPFLADDPANADFFVNAERDGHFRFDLAGFVARRLDASGIGEVAASGLDTCARDAPFFSYRRATLRGEDDYGRGLSAIALIGRSP